MSTFGDGSFKQDVWEQVQYYTEAHNLKSSEAVSALLEIVGWMMTTSNFEGEAYERGKEDAKAQILSKIY